MQGDEFVSTLADQWFHATGRMSEERAKGREATTVQGIVRSLRMTLASIAQHRDPREVGATGFVCLTDQASEPVVRHAGRALPVSSSYLKHLFGDAAVKLAPGQAILLDAAFVRQVVEEALAAIGREEAEIRDQKKKLVEAYLAADALDQGRIVLADALPSEAA